MNRFGKKTGYWVGALACAAVCILALPGRSAGDVEGLLPPELHAKLFLNALVYVNNLEQGGDPDIEVGFVYCPETARSRRQAEELMKACAAFQDKTIMGRKLRTVLIEYRGGDDFRAVLEREDLEALFIADCSQGVCAEITRATRGAKILSAGANKEQMARCGITLAIELQQNKPMVLVSLKAAAAEGKEFSSKLLRVATITDR